MTLRKSSKLYCVSDLHIHDWENNNPNLVRTKETLRFFKELVLKANQEKTKVLVAGDLFHDPGRMTNRLMSMVFSTFADIDRELYDGSRLPEPVVYCITGNHDRDGDNPTESNSWVRTLSKQFTFLECLDYRMIQFGDFAICGIPYLRGDVGLTEQMERFKIQSNFKGKKVLVIHKELAGASDTNGMVCSRNVPDSKLSQFFNGFDWVVCGHIHKPQLLMGNIVMCGSPGHQRTCDMGNNMGYWVLDINKGFKFYKSSLPEFKIEGSDDFVLNFDIPIKEKRVKTKDAGLTNKKQIDLSNWNNIVDRYMTYSGEKRKKRIKLVKNILRDVENN